MCIIAAVAFNSSPTKTFKRTRDANLKSTPPPAPNSHPSPETSALRPGCGSPGGSEPSRCSPGRRHTVSLA